LPEIGTHDNFLIEGANISKMATKQGVSMLRKVLLSSAALALATTAAYARPQVTLSGDHRTVSVMPAKSGLNVPGNVSGGVYSTLATKYPNSLYFCCYGNTVSGPSSFFGEAYGVAEQFTPSSNTTVSKLYAGVGYVSGDKSVTLTLYADNGANSPGAKLDSGKGTSDTEFGFCCGVVKARIKSTNLTAGTPYWVGITTSGANFEAAPFETVDEVNSFYVSGTSDGGSTWGAGYQTYTRPSIEVK
jgi:hypothetical protein